MIEISRNGRLLESLVPNLKEINIDIGNYANGLYQIKIVTENETKYKQILKVN